MTTIARDVAREAALRARLASATGRFSPFCCDEVATTNAVAAALADEGAPEGTFVLAEQQTAGRGRFGRAWASPPGGLYLTLLVRPRPGEAPSVRGLYGLTLSLAVLDAVDAAVGAGRAWLKWPNDLVVGDRKLAGLLSAASTDGRDAPYVAVGVGLNVHPDPARLPPEATTLTALGASQVDIDALVATIVGDGSRRIERLRAGGAEAILAEWLTRSGWQGKRVRVAPDATRPGQTVEGEVIGLGAAGELRVRRDDGNDVTLAAGDATIEKEASV